VEFDPGGSVYYNEQTVRVGVFSALCGLLLATAGCSGDDAPLDATGGGVDSLGRVTIQEIHNHEDGSLHVDAGALFVRWRGLAESTIGALLSLPGYGVDELRPGVCQLINQPQAMGAATGGRADVQLLEAGDITVKTPDRLLGLPPRLYPDVLPTVSGFVYGAATDLTPAPRYAVQSDGGEEIHYFSAGTDAPAEVRLDRLGGLDAAPGIAVPRMLDLPVQLDAPGSDGLVYVELSIGGADSQMAVRCRAATGGASAVTIPARVLRDLPAGDAELAVVRAVSGELRGAGLARGELWVEYRDELAIRLR
jgi:hypothetical protein